jgi:hypothetical protein
VTGHIHKIPYTSVVRERERTLGGNAEPNSDEAMAIARSVRDRLNNFYYMNQRGGRQHSGPVDPALDQRITPFGDPFRPKEKKP